MRRNSLGPLRELVGVGSDVLLQSSDRILVLEEQDSSANVPGSAFAPWIPRPGPHSPVSALEPVQASLARRVRLSRNDGLDGVLCKAPNLHVWRQPRHHVDIRGEDGPWRAPHRGGEQRGRTAN